MIKDKRVVNLWGKNDYQIVRTVYSFEDGDKVTIYYITRNAMKTGDRGIKIRNNKELYELLEKHELLHFYHYLKFGVISEFPEQAYSNSKFYLDRRFALLHRVRSISGKTITSDKDDNNGIYWKDFAKDNNLSNSEIVELLTYGYMCNRKINYTEAKEHILKNLQHH